MKIQHQHFGNWLVTHSILLDTKKAAYPEGKRLLAAMRS
jgi:hypothetical protein